MAAESAPAPQVAVSLTVQTPGVTVLAIHVHHGIRCPHCGKKLAERAALFVFVCPRCHARVTSDDL